MNIANIPPGRYVVAVSGGIDSVVLLHYMAQRPDLKLIVAHFDHGTRPSSATDAAFVERLAQAYHLPFAVERKALGAEVSEAEARRQRYAFLHHICKRFHASLITAHHQDDVLETMVINMMRGTGWRGICSLRSMSNIHRPFISVTKKEIRAYAARHRLEWRDDPTNDSDRYLRNRVRHGVMPHMHTDMRQELLALASRQTQIRNEIETYAPRLLKNLCVKAATPEPGCTKISLRRTALICLPATVQAEVLQVAAAMITGQMLTRPMLRYARWHIATAKPHKICQLTKKCEIYVQKATVVVRAPSI